MEIGPGLMTPLSCMLPGSAKNKTTTISVFTFIAQSVTGSCQTVQEREWGYAKKIYEFCW